MDRTITKLELDLGVGLVPPDGRRVVAVGQLTADTTVRLHAPLAPGEQVRGAAHKFPGGTAAIVAHNAAVAGGAAMFVGNVGHDDGGQHGLARLRDAGVEIGSLIETERSAEVIVLVDPDGERTMVASGEEVPWGDLELNACAHDVVFFEGWHLLEQRTAISYLDLIRRTVANGALVALDVCSSRADAPPLRDRLVSAGVSVVLANEREAEAYDLVTEPPVPLVIVHASAQPTKVVAGRHITEVPVGPAPVFDSTGAGDTFASALLVALAQGAGVLDAVAEGHRLASEVIAVPGPLLPIRQRIAIHA
jgi:ribokinase